jgi:hypothetical protein
MTLTSISEPVNEPRNELLAAALTAADRGWRVFPLAPGAKTPAVRAWEARATTDRGRIERCWNSGAFNVGLACGPSGLVVVDCDEPKPGETAPPPFDQYGAACGLDVLAVLADQAGAPRTLGTHIVLTPSGGYHLYYTGPAGPGAAELRNTAGRLGWRIDTRAHGGYVVAAGSILGPTVGGYRYRTLDGSDPVPLPRWLTEPLTPAPEPPRQSAWVELPAGRRSAYLTAALNAEISHVTGAPDGQRNNALFIAANNLGQLVAGGSLSAEDVTAVLTHAALSTGLDLDEIGPTIASGLRGGAKKPRRLNDRTDSDGAAA